MDLFEKILYLISLILLALMIGKTTIYDKPFRIEIEDIWTLEIWAAIVIFYMIIFRYK